MLLDIVLLLLVIALLFFNWLVPAPPAWVADARTKPFLDNLGEQLMAALPEDAEATLLNRIKGVGHGSDDAADTGANAAPADAADPAYDDSQRGAIDQLIENTDPGAAN